MKKPFDFDKLQKYEGKKIEVGGEVFILSLKSSLFDSTAMWEGINHYIYATPNYDGSFGVPIEVYKKSNDELIGSEKWEGQLTNYNHYVWVLKTYTERILNRAKERRKIWGEK